MPLFVGLMSGTSLDGIDAALVRCDAEHVELLDAVGVAMPGALRQQLLALCQAEAVRFADLASAEQAFCRVQAEAVEQLLERNRLDAGAIAAIGSHGQTIEHAPQGEAPYTCQLDNPSLLAELTGCRVVSDFRRRDLAAGGQAAPLAPAFHAALFADDAEWRVVLNLGGFANLTLLPPRSRAMPVTGFDTGPANTLLDAWFARHHGDGHYDADGRWAAGGSVDTALLERLLADPFFARHPPKSTGREYFHLAWLEAHLSGHEAPQDVQATLAELTARSVALGVAQTLGPVPATLIPCGGGTHNADLLQRLGRHLPTLMLADCQTFGWSADWLEAGAFAWLAWRRLEGLPGNLPAVTGAAGPRVLGGVYSA
ncbi:MULTISPECIES: anhydro-N-acetylmuramic acid kinase [unclassified Modicisalibacter]|uniref:anhydro-N-acetylmuramic acid kinase n=1 Tax=unclassified Modicisalibacter TaxID=2679913 RepID=UPI001CCC6411|nr:MULTISPECIES: anhydro-N-acetylmuramic acid kinase [unclassified Modicisalibacter]MBZ9558252.1 anhydro-N-acetylmuramic acid kinase [Modicisalibacter sp. R2A 31.J]MBZ9577359.1 anhydro-N-acetylmuramic acid kinase [Modicisalibacter sp. MOD 31.J]